MSKANEFFDRLEGIWENRLDGRWQDHFGWNFLAHPKPGRAGQKEFAFRFDQMRETATFRTVPGLARNISVTGRTEHWRAMSYQISVERPDGAAIHQELGHFLLRVLENGETPNSLRGDVIRPPTVPRANALMSAGELRRGRITDAVNEQKCLSYDLKPRAADRRLQELIDSEFSLLQKEVTSVGGPDPRHGLGWLSGVVTAPPIGEEWVFEFGDSDAVACMASGQHLFHPVLVGNWLSDFWIVRREWSGRIIDTLAYIQRVTLSFKGVEWPHVAVNTLVKQT
jgi:hypothetical protein